jgi:hypothetical protein
MVHNSKQQSNTMSNQRRRSPSRRGVKAMVSNRMGYTPAVSQPPLFESTCLANADNNAKNLVAAVTRIITNHQNKKDNTTFAYEPKVAEFYAYCQHLFSGVHESLCYTVMTGKLYEFLLYHLMRNKYKQEGKRKKEGAHGWVRFKRL